MVVREPSCTVQDFLCVTLILINSQDISRENSSIPIGENKFETQDIEVVRVPFLRQL